MESSRGLASQYKQISIPMKLKIWMLMAGLMLSFTMMAQTAMRTITGKVTSADDGQAIPGVNVGVKNRSTTTLTKADGTYSILAPSGGTLVFSFIGYVTKEVKIDISNMINVSLDADAKQVS